jgi:transcriptional regulator with XRE-family HTH domain
MLNLGGKLSDFATQLRAYRERGGLSQSALGRIIGLDASYISRIEAEERQAPRREVIRHIAKALQLSFDEGNELLVAAGYAPVNLEDIFDIHPSMKLLADIIDNDSVPSDEKEFILRQLQQIKRRYLNAKENVTDDAD